MWWTDAPAGKHCSRSKFRSSRSSFSRASRQPRIVGRLCRGESLLRFQFAGQVKQANCMLVSQHNIRPLVLVSTKGYE